jgi:hypothetical protein
MYFGVQQTYGIRLRGEIELVADSWRGRTKAQFDSARLKNAIEEVITGQGASTTDLFNDGSPRGCKV